MAENKNFISGEVVREQLKRFYEKPVTRVSLELVLSIMTVILFSVLALRPTLNTMSKLVKEIEDKRQVDDALTKKLAALNTAQNEFFTYKDRFTILETAVYENLTLEDTLFAIEYLAQKSGVALQTLRIKEFPVGNLGAEVEKSDAQQASSASKKVIGIYSVALSFSGDYQNIVAFFKEVESVRPLFSIQSFSFSIRRDRSEQAELNAGATLYTYGYVDPKSVKTEKKAAPATAQDEEANL
jgi:Tfp pilus assembly protein PilO